MPEGLTLDKENGAQLDTSCGREYIFSYRLLQIYSVSLVSWKVHFHLNTEVTIPDVASEAFERGQTEIPHLDANKSFRFLSAALIVWSKCIDLANEA